MFAVMAKKNYFWNEDGSLITPLTEDVMNTKTVQTTYEAAHCLYAGRLDKIGKGVWMGDFNKKGDIKLFPVQENEVLDIDYPWQFELCEKLWESK
jgi:CMP-N-acetylneuraminic acid synthetase